MLIINRVKTVVKTNERDFGFDVFFKKGLNLVSSTENTRGKSSVLLAIYFCLGLEQIIGGVGRKSLTEVYKSNIVDEEGFSHAVLESDLYLEISNGSEIVSIYRSGKSDTRDQNLVSVCDCTLEYFNSTTSEKRDYYVNVKNSYLSLSGFQNFLEKFLNIELPLVANYGENDSKLYFQLVFSCMFIEQKHGWGDLFSAMPYLGIREPKRRVIEFVLNLDTLHREKEIANLKNLKEKINEKWGMKFSELTAICDSEEIIVPKQLEYPSIISDEEKQNLILTVVSNDGKSRNIDQEISFVNEELLKVSLRNAKISRNYTSIHQELEKFDSELSSIDNQISELVESKTMNLQTIKNLEKSMEIVTTDIKNNEDVLKLKAMGSSIGITTFGNVCPICSQPINDSLLLHQNEVKVMSEEENISHLKSQRELLDFSLNGRKEIQNQYIVAELLLRNRYLKHGEYAKSLRNDIVSVDEEISESIVYKKMELKNRIYDLGKAKVKLLAIISELFVLSIEYRNYLANLELISKTKFSINDKVKIELFEKSYREYLIKFGYKSINDLNSIEISRESYMPISDGFDMKFGSSASDNIRSIWAFTFSLLLTSIKAKGNHPRLIIIDEPAQHSIVTEDIESLMSSILELPDESQTIIGITLDDVKLKNSISTLFQNRINIIDVGKRSLKRIKY